VAACPPFGNLTTSPNGGRGLFFLPVGQKGNELADSRHEHLDGNRDQHHAHQPFYGHQSPLAKQMPEYARKLENDAANQPGAERGHEPFRPPVQLATGQQ
jgi:hypothetical protein